ncbi:MAG: DNA methyltransferase [Phycisphaerales bacterium]
MATGALPSELRSQLERAVVAARDAAEIGARAALEAIAVHHHEPYPHMKPAQRTLRNQLRARARQLGDRQDGAGRLAIDHLVTECAYEHWHRMLFARFLAENNLLVEPDSGMAISLAEAEELAKEAGTDVWAFASRCAQDMLPQIFRPDDPLLQISFATEHMLKLERLLADLPAAVFTASDALGWVYQFWQSKKKEEVNKSEVKIGADEISAVTQLFTEPYMVEFLLHNTLGAWWAGRKLRAEDAAEATSEEELRAKLALPGIGWEYLRFVRGANDEGGPWRPAAGTFDGWPKTPAELRVLDPCCGSGHFLVAALHHLVPIRMVEEGMSAADAVDAVLRDNINGLEIDERCCQIAAFALAFEAWKLTGYRSLPVLNIACSGIAPQCSAEQWIRLAEQSGVPMPEVGREAIRNGLLNLHRLFSQAPTLGSLINPAELPADLTAADYETIQPYLTAIRAAERADYETRERANAAAGMMKAADLLAGAYTLIVTNVPYLGRGNQSEVLKSFADSQFQRAKADLATMFVDRMLKWGGSGRGIGIVAAVTPQNWLFLTGYTKFREVVLRSRTWNLVARLGAEAFQTPMWEYNIALLILGAAKANTSSHIANYDASGIRGAVSKGNCLRSSARCRAMFVRQADQLNNPDYAVAAESLGGRTLLREYAASYQGLATSDNAQFVLKFWELQADAPGWVNYRMAPDGASPFRGCEHKLLWEDGTGRYSEHALRLKAAGYLGGWKSGFEAWGRRGVAIHRMASLPVGLYEGEMFDCGAAMMIPASDEHLAAIYAYCESREYEPAVRRLNQKLSVTNATLAKVPFDLARWQKVAAETYPNGLPEPESDDPTQWLFHGRPNQAQEDSQLQVAVARLLGYRWPAERDDKMRLSKRVRALVSGCEELIEFADNDGIVCIPAVRGEDPAAERLLKLLGRCGIEPGVDLDDWLRNAFFEQHCKLFHDRPFVWHIWDGRKRDGFHALINYHKLCEGGGKGRRLLESLTYADLGEWITRQKDGVKRGEGGADDRLAAALELQKRLEAILAGEPPFDIFVRWKPLADQPVGWEADINDGVRLNIRPFLASDLPSGKKGAGILRYKPNIKWGKDRGKEPERPKTDYPWFWGWDEKTADFAGGTKFDGNRWNDCHYTNAFKQTARDRSTSGGSSR